MGKRVVTSILSLRYINVHRKLEGALYPSVLGEVVGGQCSVGRNAI